MNITDCLDEHARTRPDHPAIQDGQRILSYAELRQLVYQTAANLRSAGVETDDVVGLAAPHGVDYLVTLCGLAKLGAITLPIAAGSQKAEAQGILADFEAKAVISHVPTRLPAGITTLSLKEICCRNSNGENDLREPSNRSAQDSDRPAIVIQSSGTTGVPKSVLRTHDQIVRWCAKYLYHIGWNSADRYLAVLATTFNFGRHMCLATLQIGGTVVINRASNWEGLVEEATKHLITAMLLTPVHLRRLLKIDGEDGLLLPGVEKLIVGTAPLTSQERAMARQKITPHLFEIYASNEVGLFTVSSPADQENPTEAVGRVIPEVEVQIVDDEHRALPAGAVGQIRFRGDGYPASYYRNPEADALSFRDGWFYPGDYASIDEKGYVLLRGRSDDAISNAGVLFHPKEVENVLALHPSVEEVAVFGWPHAQTSEVAIAFVVRKTPVTWEALHAFCSDRMAGYKVPAWYEFPDELPRSALGKVVKSRLKEIFGEHLRSNNPLGAGTLER